jgi:hypothetical protein
MNVEISEEFKTWLKSRSGNDKRYSKDVNDLLRTHPEWKSWQDQRKRVETQEAAGQANMFPLPRRERSASPSVAQFSSQCGYCGGIMRPGDEIVTTNGDSGKRLHMHLNCHYKWKEEED